MGFNNHAAIVHSYTNVFEEWSDMLKEKEINIILTVSVQHIVTFYFGKGYNFIVSLQKHARSHQRKGTRWIGYVHIVTTADVQNQNVGVVTNKSQDS